jgi:tryptophan synthase alpha chain
VTGRIDARFAELRRRGRKGLIPFVTAGDPHPDLTVALMHAMVEAGADLIELGVPFSDPVADGPVIQQASERAIHQQVGIERILGWVGEFRENDAQTPVVLMGYLNPIEIFGMARFAGRARAVGVDGVLIVDVPVEESDSLALLREAGIEQIFLVAPTTTDARLAAIRRQASGFVYYVSLTGVTGSGLPDVEAVRQRVAHIKQGGDVPVAVGFGIRDAASAVTIAQRADAVVIGSALVEALSATRDVASATTVVQEFLAPIRAALDAGCVQ